MLASTKTTLFKPFKWTSCLFLLLLFVEKEISADMSDSIFNSHLNFMRYPSVISAKTCPISWAPTRMADILTSLTQNDLSAASYFKLNQNAQKQPGTWTPDKRRLSKARQPMASAPRGTNALNTGHHTSLLVSIRCSNQTRSMRPRYQGLNTNNHQGHSCRSHKS